MEKLNKVIAVVVTYNRLDWLKRCVDALMKQTFGDFDIVIVNNGSTDGTGEWLDSLENPRIHVIHQENLGGAGGFYAGQKYGMEQGYEWIWMMDDDGLPAPTQLQILLESAEKVGAKVIGPLILLVDNHEKEAFWEGEPREIKPGTITDDPSFIFPFNGLLYNREAVEKVGLVQKELFIWGDDREYHTRLMQAGFTNYSSLDAIHYHPLCKSTYDKALPGIGYKVTLKPEYFSHIFYRNNGYFNKLYNTPLVAIRDSVMYSLYFLRKGRLKELAKYLKWYWKGYRANYPVRYAEEPVVRR